MEWLLSPNVLSHRCFFEFKSIGSGFRACYIACNNFRSGHNVAIYLTEMKHTWKSYHTGNSFCSRTQTIVCRLQVWTEPKILDREAQRYEKPRPKPKRWLPGETFVALEKKMLYKNSFPKSKFNEWLFPVRSLNRHPFYCYFCVLFYYAEC